jgi:hypothetical protein
VFEPQGTGFFLLLMVAFAGVGVAGEVSVPGAGRYTALPCVTLENARDMTSGSLAHTKTCAKSPLPARSPDQDMYAAPLSTSTHPPFGGGGGI